MRTLMIKSKLAMQRIKNLREITYQHQSYLKEGKYHFTFEAKKEFVFNKHYKNINFIKKTNRNAFKKARLKKKAFFFIVNLLYNMKLNKNTGSEFKGDLLMKTRNGDIKIFNFDEDLVITFIQDENRYQTLKNNYNYFERYYKLPIIKRNDDKQYFTEKLIEFKPYRQWSKKEKETAIEKTYAGILKQSKSIEKVQIQYKTTSSMIGKLLEKMPTKEISCLIKQTIPLNRYQDQWPIIKCHGDLNFNNILLEANEFYFIDWDDSIRCTFLYDFFNCIFVDAMYYKDYFYLKKYFSGEYDQYLNELFNCWCIPFKSEYRKYYLTMYIVERILSFELVQNLDEIDFFWKSINMF